MKQKIQLYLSSLLLLIMLAIAGGCAITVTPELAQPRHHRRYVWVGEVYYEQVYYIDKSHNTIIVTQTQVEQPKKPKHHKKGRH